MPMFMQYGPCKTFRKSTRLQINQIEFFLNNTLWLD